MAACSRMVTGRCGEEVGPAGADRHGVGTRVIKNSQRMSLECLVECWCHLLSWREGLREIAGLEGNLEFCHGHVT